MNNQWSICGLLLLASLIVLANARIHHLSLSEDTREQVTISTFGYLRNGILQVNVAEFSFGPRVNLDALANAFSFVFEKTKNGGYSSFSDSNKQQEFCHKFPELMNRTDDRTYTMILFNVDLLQKKVHVKHFGKELANLQISSTFMSTIGFTEPSSDTPETALVHSSSASPHKKSKREDTNNQTASTSAKSTEQPANEKYGFDTYKPIEFIQFSMSNKSSISFKFEINIKSYSEEGLYILNFFNCFQQRASQTKKKDEKPSQEKFKPVNDIIERDVFTRSENEPRISFNLELDLLERNQDSYLSAGEMPEPTLYLTWSIIFFLAGLSWMYILKASKGDVFKIHYLMLGLVFIKSISLTFHAINMHYIAVNGRHEAIWAILFYITYFLRGLLLIVSILLVGTGWTFVKHILTENERRLFVIVIPLQILVITAYIFLEEKEEGDAVYATWRQLMFMLDLLCCGAILFPVVWSIKHLEQASKTDGKMVANLRKLRIFKHFYIMVICYIYFTRIIGYLLKQILPFRYEWFDEFCSELVTFTFFALTAYKFQPASNNPYLQLTQEDENTLNELNNNGDDNEGNDIVMDLIEHDYSADANNSSSSNKMNGQTLPSGPDSSNPTLFSRKQFIPSTQI